MVVKAVGISIAGTERFDVGGGESAAALAEVVRRMVIRRRGMKPRCIL